jgi:hypothetical protein
MERRIKLQIVSQNPLSKNSRKPRVENNLQRFLNAPQFQLRIGLVWMAMLRQVYSELDNFDPL